jgi:hypothetical protein
MPLQVLSESGVYAMVFVSNCIPLYVHFFFLFSFSFSFSFSSSSFFFFFFFFFCGAGGAPPIVLQPT